MDKEMIERCARAALTHSGNDNPSQAQLDIAKRTVYPIIKAMREPTETQYNALCATNHTWRELNSHKVWTTYIDAITGAE